MKRIILITAVCLSILLAQAAAQQTPSRQEQKPNSSDPMCPTHQVRTHDGTPQASMNERGAKGMGFSQTATTHHFLLKPDGGAIQVEVKDPSDAADRDNVRMHLRHIAEAFKAGDFEIPMFVHDTVLPGVPEMNRLREKISYTYEETSRGGRVTISSSDQEALRAIREFLVFQIREHQTGDPNGTP